MDRIRTQLTMALALDDQKKVPEAYCAYLHCMESISSYLRVNAQQNPQVFVYQPISRNEELLLKYARESLDRAVALRNNPKPNVVATSPSPTPTPAPNPTPIPPKTQTPKPLPSFPSTFSTPLPSSIPSPPATSPISVNTIVPSSNSMLLNNVNPDQLKNMNTSQLKKLHEAVSIEQMKKDLVAKQLLADHMKQQREEMKVREKKVAEFRKRMGTNRFKWRQLDQWSKYIDTLFLYSKMDSNLLEKDKNFLDKLKQMQQKHIQDSIQNATPLNSSEQVETGFDHEQHVSYSKEMIEFVLQHIRSILENEDSKHVLNTILISFLKDFKAKYSQQIMNLSNSTTPSEDALQLVQVARNDVMTFVEKLVSVLFQKYWYGEAVDNELGEQIIFDELMKKILRRGVFDYFNQIYDTVEEITEKNYMLDSKQDEFNRNGITLAHFAVKQKFRLDEGKPHATPYALSIRELKNIETAVTAEEKIIAVTNCIRLIGTEVENFWEGKNVYARKDLFMAADDLLPVFTYVFVKSGLKHLFSTLKFIELFLDEESLRGSCGYALATIESALNYIIAVSWAELEQVAKDVLHQPTGKDGYEF